LPRLLGQRDAIETADAAAGVIQREESKIGVAGPFSQGIEKKWKKSLQA
jgi:hypothetical protein